jgi:hypothetical protein
MSGTRSVPRPGPSVNHQPPQAPSGATWSSAGGLGLRRPSPICFCLEASSKHARQVAPPVAQSDLSRMQRPYPKGGRGFNKPWRGAQACPVVALTARRGAMVLVEDAATWQQPAH